MALLNQKKKVLLLLGLSEFIDRCYYGIQLADPWYSKESGLDIQRICCEVGSSFFVASLWIWDAERALREHMERLNSVKIHIDLFVEEEEEEARNCSCASSAVPNTKAVSREAFCIWDSVLKSGKFVDEVAGGGLMKGQFVLLEKILFLSNPLKLKKALLKCNGHRPLQVDMCRMYSDDLGKAVELISQQIDLVVSEVQKTIIMG